MTGNADPRCSIFREPCCDDHTICTAVAPDFVFTVRTYGTSPPYGQPLVRKFSFSQQQTSRSQPYDVADRPILALGLARPRAKPRPSLDSVTVGCILVL